MMPPGVFLPAGSRARPEAVRSPTPELDPEVFEVIFDLGRPLNQYDAARAPRCCFLVSGLMPGR